MDCRTFHQKLEDYLENVLDFSGRFGMERHARQCIRCGKAMADAQQLRQMASELHRVKAPMNFESSVLREIAISKDHGRFRGFRRYWIYGFEWPSWRRMALASTSLAILSFGIFFASHRAALHTASTPPGAAGETSKIAVEVKKVKSNPANTVEALLSKKQAAAETPKLAKKTRPSRITVEPERRADLDAADMDYVEYMLPVPDSHAVPVRLPKKIPLRYGQMSEEYFILNVSH